MSFIRILMVNNQRLSKEYRITKCRIRERVNSNCIEKNVTILFFLVFQFLNPTNDFKFATNKDTSIETFFQVSPNPDFQRMYQFMKLHNVNNVREGFANILNG